MSRGKTDCTRDELWALGLNIGRFLGWRWAKVVMVLDGSMNVMYVVGHGIAACKSK